MSPIHITRSPSGVRPAFVAASDALLTLAWSISDKHIEGDCPPRTNLRNFQFISLVACGKIENLWFPTFFWEKEQSIYTRYFHLKTGSIRVWLMPGVVCGSWYLLIISLNLGMQTKHGVFRWLAPRTGTENRFTLSPFKVNISQMVGIEASPTQPICAAKQLSKQETSPATWRHHHTRTQPNLSHKSITSTPKRDGFSASLRCGSHFFYG